MLLIFSGGGGPAAHRVGPPAQRRERGPPLDWCYLFSISLALISETSGGTQGPGVEAELASWRPQEFARVEPWSCRCTRPATPQLSLNRIFQKPRCVCTDRCAGGLPSSTACNRNRGRHNRCLSMPGQTGAELPCWGITIQ